MKSIFASKTFWVNLIALGVGVFEAATGKQLPISPDTQAMILGAINIGLRYITKDAVSISGVDTAPTSG